MTCLFVSVTNKGHFICDNQVINNGFCQMHQGSVHELGTLLNSYCLDSVQNLFKYKQSDIFDRYLQLPIITSQHLNNTFIWLLNRGDVSVEVVIKIVNHPKFWPDLFNYSNLFQYRKTYPAPHVQAGLSVYFYKRWLIKLVLLSIDIQLKDCVNLVTDPYLTTIATPCYYTKYLLHPVLYPKQEFICDRIIQITYENIHLEVYKTDIDDTIFLFNDVYLIDIVNSCYIAKIVDGEILDLSDDDLQFLRQHDRGIMIVMDDVIDLSDRFEIM